MVLNGIKYCIVCILLYNSLDVLEQGEYQENYLENKFDGKF